MKITLIIMSMTVIIVMTTIISGLLVGTLGHHASGSPEHVMLSSKDDINNITIQTPMSHVAIVYGDHPGIDYHADKLTTNVTNHHLTIKSLTNTYVNTLPSQSDHDITITLPQGTSLDKLAITAAGITLPNGLTVDDCQLDNNFKNSTITNIKAHHLRAKTHLANLNFSSCHFDQITKENSNMGKITYHDTKIDERTN